MSYIVYQGHGAEIEDDAVRMRRRLLEFSADAGHRVRSSRPRLRRVSRKRRAGRG